MSMDPEVAEAERRERKRKRDEEWHANVAASEAIRARIEADPKPVPNVVSSRVFRRS